MNDRAVNSVTFDFDEDSEISPSGEVTITGRWNGITGIANGGYQMAICLKALARLMPFPDPMVVSGFFLRPGTPGPAQVDCELLRAGRTMAFGTATLSRGGKEHIRTTAAFNHLDHNEPSFLATSPPQLPPPDDCLSYPARDSTISPPAIAERVELRVAELPGWMRGQPSGNPAVEFWLRFTDGRNADLITLPLLVDAAPPAALELGAISTTVELTVHLRARPAPGWLACRAVTRYVSGGYHEEDFEIWDSAGILVAQSRQLCLILQEGLTFQ
jgi:acyl-CoA thioesterase